MQNTLSSASTSLQDFSGYITKCFFHDYTWREKTMLIVLDKSTIYVSDVEHEIFTDEQLNFHMNEICETLHYIIKEFDYNHIDFTVTKHSDYHIMIKLFWIMPLEDVYRAGTIPILDTTV